MPRLFSRGEKRSLGLTLSKKLRVLENTPLSSFSPQGCGFLCRCMGLHMKSAALEGGQLVPFDSVFANAE